MGANAQTSVPTFTAGEILTAANMNISARTGIPVFADSTARDAAFGGTGEKTLAEGQFAYIENIAGSAATQYYDGAAWQTLVSVTPRIGQVVSTTKTDTFTTTSQTFTDITGLSVSITPTSASNKILVIASVTASNDAATIQGGTRITRNGTAVFVGDTAGNRISGQMVDVTNADSTVTQGVSFLDSPATTSALTYAVQAINSGVGTFYLNRSENDTNDVNHYRGASSITVMEVIV